VKELISMRLLERRCQNFLPIFYVYVLYCIPYINGHRSGVSHSGIVSLRSIKLYEKLFDPIE
jgi:hypothetical protein